MSPWFECSDCRHILGTLEAPCPACGSTVVTIRTVPVSESPAWKAIHGEAANG